MEESLFEELGWCADQLGSSRAAALRKAIRVLVWMMRQLLSGKRLVVIDEKGKEIEVIFLDLQI